MNRVSLTAAGMVLGLALSATGTMAATPITAPLNGATAGNWQFYTLSNGFHYDVLLPYNYSPNYTYPVVLYLHGLSTEAAPGTPPNNAFPALMNDTSVGGVNYRANYPAIVVAPQCAGSSFGSNDWGGTRAYMQSNDIVTNTDMPCGDNAMLALKTVLNSFSANTNKVYIAGYSLGGFGTYYLYLKHRWLFAAAIPVSGSIYGGLTTAQYQEKIGTHPFWAFHGAQDTTVPPTWDQNMYTAARATGGPMSFDEFVSPGITTNYPSMTETDGDGHAYADIYAFSYKPAMDWLFSQTRQTSQTAAASGKR